MSPLILLRLPHALNPSSRWALDKALGILHASFGSLLISVQHIESVMQGLRNDLLWILN